VRRNRTRVAAALAIVVAAAAVAVVAQGLGAGATSTGATQQASAARIVPLGDGHVSTTEAKRGWVYACNTMSGGGGAFGEGPWIHSNGTFEPAAKPVVQGDVSWPAARVNIARSGGRVRIAGNGLPVGAVTGRFPIASTDPAYAYDRNPNSISEQHVALTLPAPARARRPGCLTGGPVGYAVNGVAIFDALDAENRDAVAHEILDRCGGHPERSGTYHYHAIPACLTNKVHGAGAKVVGWMLDGYPIVSEPGVTDSKLDACHGRTSTIALFGHRVRTYHYDATPEYPYTIGCYHGTPLREAPASAPAGPPPGEVGEERRVP
jgi:YHYH protein